jgi:Asp-tRNA(Asn)/Glu-tRNA(Gln) amidotransferase A subunit family amidase
MAPSQLADLSITEAASGLRRKEFSPTELTRACLERIESIDHKLHSFITVTADLALEQARKAEQELRAGTDKGPLHGIPIALKDLYATKGIRTTCHSAVLQDWVPDHDAETVTKLREAGTVLNEQIRANFSTVDIFVTPSAPRPPEAFETMDPNEQNLRPSFTNPFNITGLPAISLPCGFTKDNLPVGLQIAAPPFEESTVLRIAYAFERATEWHTRRPKL